MSPNPERSAVVSGIPSHGISVSRRALLQLTGTAAGGLALSQLGQHPSRAAGPMDAALQREREVCTPPSDPLEALLARNARETSPELRIRLKTVIFDGGCPIDPTLLERGQRPWAALLSRADARVAPEFVFASGSGELFQVRCAGSTAVDDAIASMEYAVSVLGARLVLVMGHGGLRRRPSGHLMTHNTPQVPPLLVREGRSSRLGSQVWSPVTELRSDMGHQERPGAAYR